jgi:hypothetical protein
MKNKSVYPNQFINDALLKWKEGVKDKKVEKSNKARGTILIPQCLEEFYCSRAKELGSGYLKYLVESYAYLLLQEYSSDAPEKEWLAMIPKQTLNMGYQETGLELQKHYVEVEANIWAMLKQIRNVLNQSVCKIVTLLVYFDWLGIEENIPLEVKQIVVPCKNKFILHYEAQINTKMFHYTRRSKLRRFDMFE